MPSRFPTTSTWQGCTALSPPVSWGQVWKASVARKLTTLRGLYDMLNGEAQTARAEWLEFAIILLIALEIVLRLAGR